MNHSIAARYLNSCTYSRLLSISADNCRRSGHNVEPRNEAPSGKTPARAAEKR